VSRSTVKKPTKAELSHGYLWRVQTTAKTGSVGVFDRSHYEDVLICGCVDSQNRA
jgi:polyphosphate kinase 2 (PPK2 family)